MTDKLIQKGKVAELRQTHKGYNVHVFQCSDKNYALLSEAQDAFNQAESIHAEAVEMQRKIDSGELDFLDALDTIEDEQ